MRKILLAAAGGMTAGSTLLLILAAAGVAEDIFFPVGVLTALGAIQSTFVVLLLGQRTVMVRTSAISRAVGTNPNPPTGPKTVDANVAEAIEASMQSLAWSIDARLVGMMEQFAKEGDRRDNG